MPGATCILDRVTSTMIKRPTVLVLGAGASYPLGFPLGRHVRDLILRRIPSDNEFIDDLCRYAELNGYGPVDKEMFPDFAKRLPASRMPVDEFLAVSSNADLVDVGRLCMAQILIELENPEIIAESQSGSKTAIYDAIWERLRTKQPEELKENAVKIVTYNYDRSFEEYLHFVISNTYGLSSDDGAMLLCESFDITHVHGQLGYHPAFSPDGSRPYQNRWDRDRGTEIVAAARQILIADQPSQDSDAYVRARTFLKKDVQIIFVGFGYSEDNLRRLTGGRRVKEIVQDILPCFYQMKPAEAEDAARRLGLPNEAGRFRDNLLPGDEFIRARWRPR